MRCPDDVLDAPSRESRYDLNWEAHSFLCVSPDAVLSQHVRAIAGFGWGFTITSGHITRTRPTALGPEAWDSHLGLLRASSPKWVFDAGYRSA